MHRIALVAPCYNEGQTVVRFLESVEKNLRVATGVTIEVIVVDDASSDDTPDLLKKFSFACSHLHYRPIRLRFNLGHQMAIQQGLAFACTLDVENIVVMDSDGEDDPAALPELISKRGYDIVNVTRGRRSETLGFRLGYSIYKGLFRFVTGKEMNFGNYCMVSKNVAQIAVHKSYVHFPAFLLKQKLSRFSIKVDRAPRIDGKSKMNTAGLIYHAFKSLVEFSEDLLMIFLKLFVLIMILFMLALGNVLWQKFFAHTAILGWTSMIAIGLFNLAIISIGFFVLGILLLNLSHQRNQINRERIYDEVQ
jgi:glycosyltransferase involved in cell wall biosynthesis